MNLMVRQTFTVKSVLLLIVGPIIFVALGVWMITSDGGSPIIGWASVVFFGGGGAFALWRQFVSGRELLVIDDEGISGVGRVGAGRWSVPWSRVGAVYAVTQHAGTATVQHVAVADADVKAQHGRMTRLTGGLVGVPNEAAGQMVAWNPGVKPPIDDVLAAIAARGVVVYDKR